MDAPKNATYLSPEMQNEALGCLATLITRKIVDEINGAGMFTLMADETSAATREFVTIVIRYLTPEFEIKVCFTVYILAKYY